LEGSLDKKTKATSPKAYKEFLWRGSFFDISQHRLSNPMITLSIMTVSIIGVRNINYIVSVLSNVLSCHLEANLTCVSHKWGWRCDWQSM